jgi:hypothetical protein
MADAWEARRRRRAAQLELDRTLDDDESFVARRSESAAPARWPGLA